MSEFRIGGRFHPGRVGEGAKACNADLATTHFTNLRTIRPQLTNYNALHDVPVAVHAPYAVNLGHHDPFVRRMSFEQLRLNAWLTLDRQGHSVTWHAGTRGGDDWLDYWRRIADYDWPVPVLVENGANVKGSVACRVDDVAELFDVLRPNPHIGFTFDTAHVYAYLDDADERLAYVRDVREATGDRIWLIHSNGSASTPGSGRDQHAPFASSNLAIDEVVDLVLATGCRDMVCETSDPLNDIDQLRRRLDVGATSSVTSGV